VENQVIPKSDSESKEGVSEGSKGVAGDCSWTKELIKVLLSNLVWVFSFLTKVVGEG
jgi:hypothetical protein